MSENDCDPFRSKLQRFADGELGGAESRELRAHLLDCVDCRSIVGEVYSLRKFFRAEAAPAVPQGFASRVVAMAFANGPMTIDERTVLPFAKSVAAIAAAAVLAAGCFFFLQSNAARRVGFEAQARSPGKIGATIEQFRKSRVKDASRFTESAPEKVAPKER